MYTFINNFKIMGLNASIDDFFLTGFMGSINAICYGSFRPIFGILFDKFGFKKCLGLLLAIQFVVSLNLNYCLRDKYLYLFVCALAYISLGAIVSLFAAHSIETFGLRFGA